MWDATKETPNLDERARYKALSLLNTNTKKDAIFENVPQRALKLDILQFGMIGFFESFWE